MTIRLASCVAPACLPCTSVVCNYCTDFIASIKPIWEIPPYTLSLISSGFASATLSFSGKSQGSVCGSGLSFSEVPTFTGLSAEFDLPGSMTNVVYCGVRASFYGVESTDRDLWGCSASVDVSSVVSSLAGNSVSVSASTVTLPTGAYYGGTIPDNTNVSLYLIFSAIFGGSVRYIRVDLTWSWDGTYADAPYYVFDGCTVNTQTCLGTVGEGLRGYVDGLSCATFDPPTSCSEDEITAYTTEYDAAFILGGC